jgi:2-polyprenyl-3-methyl-5-hydroxy-6-metoxy-1,4-benzoquinol methylase
MNQTTYSRFKDYDKIFTITSSELIFPPEIYNEIRTNIKGTVLDVGTADGYKLERILQEANLKQIDKVVAIEPSPLYAKAEKRFKKNDNVEVYNLCLEDLNAINEKFDTILMLEIIEHMSETENTMKEIISLLNPNGILICSTPNRWIYHITEKIVGKKPDPTHINEMTSNVFTSLMSSYFQETKCMGVLPFMTIGRKIPKLLILNRYFSFIPISRTIYCFARKPKAIK